MYKHRSGNAHFSFAQLPNDLFLTRTDCPYYGQATAASATDKMKMSQMMDSAQESHPHRFPLSIKIEASDQFIGDKLADLLARLPMMNGGVDALQMDGRSLSAVERIPNVLAEGGEITHLVDPGFSIHLADGKAMHDWSIRARASQDCVRLRFPIEGEAQYQAENGSVVDEKSACTFIVQPADASLTGIYRRGVAYRYCSLDMSRSFLVERLGICEELLPSLVTTSWERHEIAFGRIELKRETLLLLQRLFTLWSDDVWATIQAQGIGMMIISQIFSAWHDQRQIPGIVVRLRPSERLALARLRVEAERRCPLPVSVSEAQAISGLNRNKIHYGFKELYGSSLQRFCTDIRMRKAVDMLQNSSLAIAEVAEELGYSEPTNFTAAFSRYVGQLPSDFRKRE